MERDIDYFFEKQRLDMSRKRDVGIASCGDEKCESVAHKRMEVDTPVKIEVTSRARSVRIDCRKPIICGYSEPECHRKSSCEFVVKQFIDVRIPICYHVKTNVGESFVKCKYK